MTELAIIALYLPDGRIVMQRRDGNAPISPNLLGFFGGHMEEGEDAPTTMHRELKEETSLNVEQLDIQPVGTYTLTPQETEAQDTRTYHLFRALIPSLDFEVYEGERAEAYDLEELVARPDLARSIKLRGLDLLKEEA